MKFLINNKINFLFIIISAFSLFFVVGFENISFQSTKWLHQGNDSTLPQMGWYFFGNDIWRFPLGSNPNYGDEFGSSIIFADSIPILSLIFKLFKPLLPDNFQYISIWYFLCFYLQLFFSFKIIEKITNSTPYSFIASIFFLTAPIFLWKLQSVPALTGQWVLLIALYLGLTKKIEDSKLLWNFLIALSSLINFYFMIMILGTYTLLRILNLKFDKKSILVFVTDFLIVIFVLLSILYITGYFEVRMVDTMALGFGRDKLNLLSIFDSYNTNDSIPWSWFLPDIKLTEYEEYEGFNYVGLGQILMLFFALILFFQKKNKINLYSIANDKKIKTLFIVSIFFTFWALSNKISFGSYTILEIPLNKYIYGLFSIVRPTGRLFWIVNYFLLTMSIIIIFKCLNKRNSLLIISLLLIVQLADTSAGIKHRINLFMPIDDNKPLNDKIWEDLFKEYKILKTTYPKNYSGLFDKFSYLIEKYDIEKTNLVKLARINRKAIAEAKYYLYENFRKKKLSTNTVYAIDNLSHLRHLKHLFKDENVGFFYRDNVWVMVVNEKERMNENDKELFNRIRLKLININEKNNLTFEEKNNFYGFGWSHNFGKAGVWSEGKISTLFFRIEKDYGDLKLEIVCKPYNVKEKNISEFDVYVNNSLNKSIKLTNYNNDEKIKILIKQKNIINNVVKIDFMFKNLVSPYEMLESPDSRKLGILLKNITIKPI